MSGSHHTLQILSRAGAKMQWFVSLEIPWIRKISPKLMLMKRIEGKYEMRLTRWLGVLVVALLCCHGNKLCVTSWLRVSYFHEGTLSELLPLPREPGCLMPGSQHHPRYFCCPVPGVEKCEAAVGDQSQAAFYLFISLLRWPGCKHTVFHLHDLLTGHPCLPSLGPCLEVLDNGPAISFQIRPGCQEGPGKTLESSLLSL